MEDLTKHQLILLTLLVSFITSIGTGIITFTLLQEAPVEVTQTINRVVEKTIERVVTEPGQPEKVVTTVVVNEEDRVLEAISKNERSIVRLRTGLADGSQTVAGIGLVVSADGIIVVDSKNYRSTVSYEIVFHDGKTYPIGKVYIDDENGLAFLKTNVPKNDNSKYVFYSALLGDSDNLKIGQTLVAVNGRESNAVSIGRVRQLTFAEDKKTVTSIDSDISVLRDYAGSPALNLSGEVIAVQSSLLEGETTYSYTPINRIKAAMVKALQELAK